MCKPKRCASLQKKNDDERENAKRCGRGAGGGTAPPASGLARGGALGPHCALWERAPPPREQSAQRGQIMYIPRPQAVTRTDAAVIFYSCGYVKTVFVAVGVSHHSSH